jgi:hypothetical protein
LAVPALLIGATGASAQLCARSPGCSDVGVTGEAFHLAEDVVRATWLAQVVGFMERRVSSRPDGQ